jgi:hypothetical protein
MRLFTLSATVRDGRPGVPPSGSLACEFWGTLALDQISVCLAGYHGPMLRFCSAAGYPVQGWFAHGMSRDCKDIFEGVICLACGGVHLVNPKTGKVLGAVEKANPQHT